MKFQKRTDNQYKSISSEILAPTKVYAQCFYHLHPGYMTHKQFKNHRCLEKCCPFFSVNIEHTLLTTANPVKSSKHKKAYLQVINKLRSINYLTKEEYKQLKEPKTEQFYLDYVDSHLKVLQENNKKVAKKKKIKKFFDNLLFLQSIKKLYRKIKKYVRRHQYENNKTK